MLRQIETRGELPEDQIEAALTYLEVAWLQARRHAVETDSARLALGDGANLGSAVGDRDGFDMPARGDRARLPDSACHYCTAVRRLRSAVAARVAPLLGSHQAGPPAAPVIRRLGGDGPEAERAASAGADRHAHGSP